MSELSPRGKALSRIIFSQHDKPERFRALAAAYHAVEPLDVAHLFRAVWTNSESVFRNHREIAILLAFLRTHDLTEAMMAPKDLEQFRELTAGQDRVRLYRGCARHCLNGYSWTTSEEEGLKFATINGLDGWPILLTAEFLPSDLIAYFGDRDESEVVVDIMTDTAQDALALAEETRLPEQQVSAARILAWQSQTLGEIIGDTQETRDWRWTSGARMYRERGTPFEDLTRSFDKQITELETFGDIFADKIAEIRRIIDLMRQVYDEYSVPA